MHINIPESEGTHNVQGLELKVSDVAKPVKIKKVNIGTEEEPKFTSIGDYWDDETVESIVDLLRDYQDLFPTKFTEVKGILGEESRTKILWHMRQLVHRCRVSLEILQTVLFPIPYQF